MINTFKMAAILADDGMKIFVSLYKHHWHLFIRFNPAKVIGSFNGLAPYMRQDVNLTIADIVGSR